MVNWKTEILLGAWCQVCEWVVREARAPPWGGHCPGGGNERHALEVSEPNRCVCLRADRLRALTLPELPVQQRLSTLAAYQISPGELFKFPAPNSIKLFGGGTQVSVHF